MRGRMLSFLKKLFKKREKAEVVERYWVHTPHGSVEVIRYTDGRIERRGSPEALRWTGG